MSRLQQIFKLDKVPVLTNRTYQNRSDAIEAKFGKLTIVADDKGGLAINKDFDQKLVVYDREYNNDVPSKTFTDYYDQIIAHLTKVHDLKSGLVIEIGCGNGKFLHQLADRCKWMRGLGVDPAYSGPNVACDGRLNFEQEHFSEKLLAKTGKPSLILCRHVLEHIPLPTKFLTKIFSQFSKDQMDIPVFIEVPGLDWILENQSVWDFCYEHVNYFNADTLSRCIEDSGATVTSVSTAFGQYLWGEAVLNPSKIPSIARRDNTDQSFFANISSFDDKMSQTMAAIKNISLERKIVIWGMATKGVMYSLYLLSHDVEIDSCVDVNQMKQGTYSPLTGVQILPPTLLVPSEKYAIICMNPNYAKEIELQCRKMGLQNVEFYTPHGEPCGLPSADRITAS